MEQMKSKFMKVKNASYPAELYWDDVLLLYKRGNTTSITEFAPLQLEDFEYHFFLLFAELLKNHKNDHEAQVSFFLPEFNKRLQQKLKM